ncbi:MAG: hypothetical protein FWD51_01030 [Betaproteobacteria bacterium]|nr:hypothetical protein [Betaproteobacteria bacterium]
MKNRSILTLAPVAPFIIGGCAANLGGSHYSRDEARQTMSIRFATVVSVRPVRIEGTKTSIGTAAGTATGGVIGYAIGDRMGSNSISRSIGAVLGGVAGGVGGAAAEEAITRTDGMEITVKLENGEVLAVVQQDGDENFQTGERVSLIGGSKATRVTRDAGA